MPITPPDTLAGRQLADYLEIFNSGDLDKIEVFVAKLSRDSALQGMSAMVRAQSDRILFHNVREVELILIVESDEFHLLCWGQSTLSGAWLRIEITLNEGASHLITRLRIRLGFPPPKLIPDEVMEDKEIVTRLEGLLNTLDEVDIFSGTVLLAKHDDILFRGVYGLASHRFSVPNELDTKFNVGSLYKMFTAVSICQLAESGKLDFTDSITKHLPDFPSAIADKVTIHHLLTHMGGMGQYWNDTFRMRQTTLRKVADYTELYRDDPLLFEPGERWGYSNAGYMALGLIIEAVSGQDYFEYIEKNIFQRARMENTAAYEMDRPVKNLAIGYTHSSVTMEPEWGERRNNLYLHVVKGGPGGGGFSTVEDIYRFGRALEEHRLLGPEMTEILLKGKVRMGRGKREYAYGFMVGYPNGQTVTGHSGTFPGIGALLELYRELGYTVVVLCNYDPIAVQIIENRLRVWLTQGRD